MQIIQQVIAAIFIASVSSWVTFKLSMRKYRSEWLWKRKAEAYSEIIEALHKSKAYLIVHMDSEEKGEVLTEGTSVELGRRAREGYDAILRAIDMGSFILSEKACERLLQYKKETDAVSKKQSYYCYLDDHLATIVNCLKDIVPIARKELKTR